MKKIIMAVAAIAMAASMFAADVSAGTKISGSLFGFGADGQYGFSDGKITLFSQSNDSHSYANPNFVFNIADDRAGASLKITTDGNDNAPTLKDQAIWFKPIDMLKITVGAYDVALNKETIDWTESITGLGGEGFLVSLNIDAFGLDFGLNNGDGWDTPWFAKGKEGDPVIKNFFLKGGYSAGFGSVGAFVNFNHPTPASWETAGKFYKYSGSTQALSDISFGAGYKGSFGPVSAFVNVIADMYDSKMKWIRPELFVSGGVDAFGFAAFVAPGIYLDDTKANCEVIVKLTYGLGGVTPYLYFKDGDILADKFAATFKLGANGSVGLMGWDVCVQLDTAQGDGTQIKVQVPFSLSVNF